MALAFQFSFITIVHDTTTPMTTRRDKFVILSLVTILLGISISMYGQAQAPYERILVPIAPSSQPGAHGSLWSTLLTARNESDAVVEVSAGRFPCVLQPPCGYLPRTTFAPPAAFDNSNGGLFYFVGAPGAGKVTFNLRTRDMSRQALSWGTSIPVIREAGTFTTTLELLNIPTDSRFRVALRVYDFESPNARSVRLRIYDQAKDNPVPTLPPQTALVDTVLKLDPPFEPQFDAIPGSAAMTDLIATFPQLAQAEILRIVLDPISSDLRFWAFASVTNNEMQHVTVIAPN
jgi:hypothetical protein